MYLDRQQAFQRKQTFGCSKNLSVLERMRRVMVERGGFLALYRGIWPGTIRSFLSNGSSMVVMVWAQKKVSEMGLRDK